jgi:beta-lactamase regulating signal transducer with metallopeptidase domain
MTEIWIVIWILLGVLGALVLIIVGTSSTIAILQELRKNREGDDRESE